MILDPLQAFQGALWRQADPGRLQPLSHHPVEDQGQETEPGVGANPVG